VILPEQCSLLREPCLLYGYDSHDRATGILKAEYRPKVWKGKKTIKPLEPGQPIPACEPPASLKEIIAKEEAENPRPEWARSDYVFDPLQSEDRTDGGIHENV
jgi:hypothetical protein